MKSLLTRACTFAAALLPAALVVPAGAQSLGAAAADSWIGRPLELSVPARFASADSGDECVQADVSYGDQRLPRAQVRTSLSGPAGGERTVRIVADAPITEPVVTVSLRAGCGSSVTRTYTLLPAMPTSPVLAAAAARAVGAPPAAVASPVRAAATAPATTLRPAAQDRPARPRAAAQAPRAARDAREAGSGGGGGPRLRLDAWEPDPQVQAQTLLRVSAKLTEPTQDAGARAAAALLWQALNADPSELMRTSATLQRLEGELAQLRTSADQTRAEMAALRQALEAPPDGLRLSGGVAQALLALVLAAAAAVAFFWWRSARQAHLGGWRGEPLDSALDGMAASRPPAARREAAAVAPAGPQPAAAHASGVSDTLPPLDFNPSAAAPLAVASPGPQARVETLLATFQEAEFLGSLGMRDEARKVLETYIDDARTPAPIAFFELLRLHAAAGNDDAAEAVRRRYADAFGAQPPSLQQVEAPQGLQARAELSTRISRNWDKPQALGMIEDLLFAVPAPDKALSLEAGRDLMCLYQVAGELRRQDASGPDGADDEHGLAPWAHSADAAGAADFHGGYGFGLDLDLGAPDHAGEVAVADASAGRELTLAPVPAPAPAADSDAFSDAVAHDSRRPLPR